MFFWLSSFDFHLSKTARQYLYGDDDALKESLEKVEEAEDEGEGEADGEDLSLIGKLIFFIVFIVYQTPDIFFLKLDAKTYSCLEAIQDVVGETIPEEVIVKMIKKCKYDSEKALDMLLNRNNTNTTKTTISTPKLPQGKVNLSPAYLSSMNIFSLKSKSIKRCPPLV